MSFAKIVHVIAYYPPSLGGMEKVAEYLARQQARDGKPVEVVTSNVGYTPTYADDPLRGYSVSRLAGKKIANLPIIPGVLFRLLAQPKHSIFHCHVAQAFLPEIAWLAARLRRSKFIVHFHVDAAPSGAFGFIFSFYKKTLFPLMLRGADAVVVFSQSHKSHVIAKYHLTPERVHIVPNGVASEFFSDVPRHLHTPARLLFVGRLEAQKNVSMLLESLAHTASEVETNIVGSGDQRSGLVETAKRLDLDGVTFAGRKDKEELLDLYRWADMFVLTSDREGMPLVLLEAMAMGLPIVATDVEGTRDVVVDGVTGTLVPLGDARAFGKAIDALAGQPEQFRALSRAARAMAEEYDWQKVATKIGQVYDQA